MRITKCAWCGKANRLVAQSYGFPRGLVPMLGSERFPTVNIHADCLWGFRRELMDQFGDSVYKSPFFVELSVPDADTLRNA